MKSSVKKALLLELIIIVVAILNFFLPNIFSENKYLILLLFSLIYLRFTLNINLRRNSNDRQVLRNVLICVVAYYLIIYLLGLLTGFARAIYSYTISNLVYNILPSVLTIVGTEIVRYTLINKTNKNKLVTILSCIMFIVFEISFSFKSYNFGIKEDIFQFIGLLIIVSIIRNLLMTFMSIKTDCYPAIIYRLLTETIVFVLLIEPDLGYYIKSVSLIILPFMVGLMIINVDKRLIMDKPKNRKTKLYLIILIILLILVLLNTGLIKYQTMVIGSNSMLDYMAKGDVIFIERLKNDDRKTVEIGEILVFKYDERIINHRVVKKIKRGKEVYYKTKGDNNNQEDGIFIPKEAVLGKTLFRIKYVGLPSVWLNELFD